MPQSTTFGFVEEAALIYILLMKQIHKQELLSCLIAVRIPTRTHMHTPTHTHTSVQLRKIREIKEKVGKLDFENNVHGAPLVE